jgi:hypothetical protein
MDATENQQTKPLSDCRYVSPSEISKFHAEALSGDYQHVLQTILSWVAVDTTEEHDLDTTETRDDNDFAIYDDDLQSLDADKFEFSLAGYIEPTEEYYLKDIRFYHRLIHSALKEETVSVDKIKNYMVRIDKNEADLDELRERIARRENLALLLCAEARAKACSE